MSDVLNPVDLENQILAIKDTCHRGVDVFKEKYQAFLDAETEYEHLKAQSFLAHDGPQTEKRPAAEVASHEARKAMNRAKVEYEYTRKKLDVYIAELAALQNLNRGVRSMYNAERGYGG